MEEKKTKQKYYLVRKDGCWLAEYRNLGIKEFVGGELVPVPTAVYASDMTLAKTWEHKSAADIVAKMVGGRVMEIMV